MQMAAPELTDLSKESAATKALYGLGEARTAEFGGKCLLARRLVERGVPFVELLAGSTTGGGDLGGPAPWHRHHATVAGKVGPPIAGMLARLKCPRLLAS